MPAPTKYPDWATDGTNTVEPPAGKVAAGWLPAEQPPAGWFNWWQNLVGQWSHWLDSRITTLQAEVDGVEDNIAAISPRIAFKDQANNFTVPQTISANVPGTDALTVTGHIVSTAGSIGCFGPGANLDASTDVRAGHDVTAVRDVTAGRNVTAVTDVTLDTGDFKYKAARTRTTFVPIFSGWGSAVINGGSGNQGVHAAYNLKFLAANAEHVFPIVLPQGAVLTAFDVLVWKGNSATMYAELNKRTNHNFEKVNPLSGHTLDQTSLTKPQDGASLQETRVIAGTCNVTFDNRAEDSASGGSEYLLSVIAGNANDEIHAIRLVWTDPGPRNY